MFTLTFNEPGRRPQSHPLDGRERGLLIGRDDTCDVVLKSKDVSRRHARVWVRGAELLVEDLGSHNGVFLRGERIGQVTACKPGELLEIGDVRVQVAVAQPEVRGVGAGAVLRGSGRDIRLPAKAAIGRGAECDVVLDDDSVSRRHAELARDDRGFYRLRDLESANGTLIDGKRISGDPELLTDGARLRFGDVELSFHALAVPAGVASRHRLLLGAFAAALLLAGAVLLLRPARRDVTEDPGEGEQAIALADQAQAAIESERFDEAARLAQAALDKDPIGAAPRRLLAQARREQQSQKAYADALAKAQVGREDEAISLLAQVPAESRFFPRARIKAKDLAGAVLRSRSAACRSASNARETAEECSRALDLKCQQSPVERDPMLKALRAAEKSLRRVAWSCPPQLAALFRDEGGSETAEVGERALAALYPDAAVRAAMTAYARGDVPDALRKLSTLRGKSDLVERIKVVDGRFREGQTALLRGALDRSDQLWGEALQADAALMPRGADSFFAQQMRGSLSRAHANAGDDKLARAQYAGAYDEWVKGLAFTPRDPHLLDQVARMEKVAEGILGGNASCDQLAVAAHITRAEPPSAAHQAAQDGLGGCR